MTINTTTDPTARYAGQLIQLIQQTPWLMAALRAVRDLALPDGCIGAGTLRNLVWDHLHDYPTLPSPLSDVDVVYFEPGDLSSGRDHALQQHLQQLLTDLQWEVTNQAGVHLWFAAEFGHAVPPLRSIEDAIASWPEPATAVAVALQVDDTLRLIAPLGLDDLFAMRIQRNPARVSVATYRQRLAQKRYAARWPQVSIHHE
ncbi:hypothetical protein IGB42_00216 [Andreprevotia sp. IGB-42]|uniref:nucleotidyltransferase family protein n=1 Tax=Andreprevotia sp. IGB-42 TaxID=2497473 RepID=UPI00157EE389|nr:nucleotidyltransferase family protein [Andreprevotia sp. IGB-42]KAF0815139.1 hypothetical protein IGB42_00216 [Andreprevotia sp. IGB-42]